MSVGLGEGLKIEYLTPPTGDAAVSGRRSHFGTPWSTLSSVKAPRTWLFIFGFLLESGVSLQVSPPADSMVDAGRGRPN